MDIKMANRLIELRKKHGYSQEDLADRLDISRQAVSKWERAESSPDTDNLIALSKLYSTTIDAMLFDNAPQIERVNSDAETIEIDDSEADDYLRMYKRGGLILGLGVACNILAVILLLSFMSTDLDPKLGFLMFFVTLVVGVGVILYAVVPLRRFEYIERTKKLIKLSPGKNAELIEKHKRFSPKFLAFLIMSISTILLSVVPIVIFQELFSVIIMLGMIALAVLLIVRICFEYSAYEKLLNTNKKKQ